MKLKDWIELNQRTRPVMKELTDEFLEMCEKEPENIMMRLARLSGLPEGVNPADKRIMKLFGVEEPDGVQNKMDN